MIGKFGLKVDLAVRTNDAILLACAYEDALMFPSVQTTIEMERNGFVLDGMLINGNDNLQICFKQSVPHVLKICSREEYERAKEFENALKDQPLCEWIISFELYERYPKYFMFMPLHPVTLEHLPFLVSDTAHLFWACLSGALDFLHHYGFAHNDVKPANILINTRGEFILTDLGSLVPFGLRSASTQAYIPRELWDRRNGRGPVSSISTDFWMLAMTIFEKVCRGVICGAESPMQSTITEAIVANSKCADFYRVLLDRLKVQQV